METEPCTFVSVLEFYYGIRRTASYDVQVLATSLNQYLHHVFESLDFADLGVIGKTDFSAFLSSLSLHPLAENVAKCSQKKLSFRAFHEYIGQYYAALGRRTYVAFDCRNTEKEYKDSLRSLWTIGRSTVTRDCLCHSHNSTGLNPSTSTPTSENRSFSHVTPIASLRQKECIVCSQCQSGAVEVSDSDELDNLREVVEELRTSLQISDARRMALEVRLQKAKFDDSNEDTLLACSSSNSSGISSGEADEPAKNDRYLLDMQVELKATRRRLYAVTQQNKTFVYYVEKMMETFEKTKSAILSSLDRVKHLETQARESTNLETRILELQRELERTRKCLRRNSADLDSSGSGNSDDSLMGDTKDASHASVDDCRTRVEDLLIGKLQEQVQNYCQELDGLKKEKLSLQNYINKLRCGRDNMAHDLKATESERVRLSIVEEKLIDVVAILRHIRKMMLPRATVGNLVIQALEQISSNDVIAEDSVLHFVQSLVRKLSAYELSFSQPTTVCKWVTYV